MVLALLRRPFYGFLVLCLIFCIYTEVAAEDETTTAAAKKTTTSNAYGIKPVGHVYVYSLIFGLLGFIMTMK